VDDPSRLLVQQIDPSPEGGNHQATMSIFQKILDTVGREGPGVSGGMDEVVEDLGAGIIDVDSAIFGADPDFSSGTDVKGPDFVAVKIAPVVGHGPEIPELLFVVDQEIDACTGAYPGIAMAVVEDVKDRIPGETAGFAFIVGVITGDSLSRGIDIKASAGADPIVTFPVAGNGSDRAAPAIGRVGQEMAFQPSITVKDKHPVVIGPGPDLPVVIGEKAPHLFVVGGGHRQGIGLGFQGGGIEEKNAPVGTQPKFAVVTEGHDPDKGGGEGSASRFLHGLDAGEFLPGAITPHPVVGADPQPLLFIFSDLVHRDIFGNGFPEGPEDRDESLLFPVEEVKTAVFGSGVEVSPGVFAEGPHQVPPQGGGITGFADEPGKPVAVKTADSLAGAEPHKAPFVLVDALHLVVAQSVLLGEKLETEGVPLCRGVEETGHR